MEKAATVRARRWKFPSSGFVGNSRCHTENTEIPVSNQSCNTFVLRRATDWHSRFSKGALSSIVRPGAFQSTGDRACRALHHGAAGVTPLAGASPSFGLGVRPDLWRMIACAPFANEPPWRLKGGDAMHCGMAFELTGSPASTGFGTRPDSVAGRRVVRRDAGATRVIAIGPRVRQRPPDPAMCSSVWRSPVRRSLRRDGAQAPRRGSRRRQ